MTKKDFEELASKPGGYEELFSRAALYQVEIGGYVMPCMKVGRKYAGLRDGSLVPLETNKDLKWLKDEEKEELLQQERVIHLYRQFNQTDRQSVRLYMELLSTKENMERNAKKGTNPVQHVHSENVGKKNPVPDKICCSFCGKPQEQVLKLIAGPDGAFICDECTEICMEILEEELE